MTSEKRQPNGPYKQVYYRGFRERPYTSSTIGYDDYLHTEVWRELRNKRLKMDFFRCVCCGTGKNVSVHHLNYPDVWGTESVEDDLITLCASCHAETHKYDIAGVKKTEYADLEEIPFK